MEMMKSEEGMSRHCIQQFDKDGMKYIDKLIRDGDEETFRLLLSARSDIMEMRDVRSRTPFLLAAWYNQLNIMKLLARKGCRIDVKDDNGMTPFLLAAWYGKLGIMKELVRHGCKVDVKGSCDWTALHLSSFQDHCTCVAWLCQNYPELIDEKDDDDFTALHDAIEAEHLGTVDILLGNNANVLIKTVGGLNALDMAKRCNKPEYLKQLEKSLRKQGMYDDGMFSDCRTVDDFHVKYPAYRHI